MCAAVECCRQQWRRWGRSRKGKSPFVKRGQAGTQMEKEDRGKNRPESPDVSFDFGKSQRFGGGSNCSVLLGWSQMSFPSQRMDFSPSQCMNFFFRQPDVN
mmetsp:Transcript_23727/g.46618  ORF Transcript_23727/g.46618 Transcript_23727/m.46618 type:complete len:101 (+) Transcript_23727:298-600(+)